MIEFYNRPIMFENGSAMFPMRQKGSHFHIFVCGVLAVKKVFPFCLSLISFMLGFDAKDGKGPNLFGCNS